FLQNIRQDYDRAEELYERALSADANDANSLGNYAGFLLGRGELAEGSAFLRKALVQPNLPEALQLELCFYRLAHLPEEWAEALLLTKTLLTNKVRSPGWDLSINCQQAAQQNHPHSAFLNHLAQVIANTAEIESLTPFACWNTLDL
ncbi:tetratricopeptide repeat protein, partial [Candidatus Magnetaquicoccus inordinatus]|uniref:tetratricopeptide repeat protein n=1 Tax=Candidatus Magnetaquicoccus inordinatus TaxID=2496818 RepID=UPI00102B3E77